MEDPPSENYETLLKEIKGDTDKWKDILYSQVRRKNIVEMAISPKASTNSIQPHQNTKGILHRGRKGNLVCVWNHEGP